MENISFGFDGVRRRFDFSIPLKNIGFTGDWPVDAHIAHTDFFFSFITKGKGELFVNGKGYRLQAPCVFIQYPGELMHHRSIGVWNELYIGFSPETVPELRAMKLFSRSKPTWRIERSVEFMECHNRVLENLRNIAMNGVPELLERQVQELILLSQLPSVGEREVSRGENLREVITFMERNLAREISIPELAAASGVSYSTFMRLWHRVFSVPPQRYLIRIRMEKAASLLLEQRLRINEVAELVGFGNAFYFSKAFHDFFKESPSEYRKKRSER